MYGSFANAENYNESKNNATMKILGNCNDSVAPPGSEKRLDPGQFDVVKKVCLCYADNVVENYYPDFSKFTLEASSIVMKYCAGDIKNKLRTN